MLNSTVNMSVVIVAFAALAVTMLSLYISRFYLPMKIKAAYRNSITALAAAVETKDSGTAGHARRVADLTVDVARRMGVSGKDLETLEFAALLRDIGKARVPQAILKKADALNETEWNVVKSHSQIGAEMVGMIPFLAHTAELIRHHHEYWNGSGYPDGLAGQDIPLGSRILAVASDFDAMISERPYHCKPLSLVDAADEIRRGSGTKYDPAVAEIFLSRIKEDPVQNLDDRAA